MYLSEDIKILTFVSSSYQNRKMFKGGIIDIEKRLAVTRRGRYSLSPPLIKSNNTTHTGTSRESRSHCFQKMFNIGNTIGIIQLGFRVMI